MAKTRQRLPLLLAGCHQYGSHLQCHFRHRQEHFLEPRQQVTNLKYTVFKITLKLKN
jgi:hypothetical protein